MNQLKNKLIIGTMAYGFVRKLFRVYDAQVNKLTADKEKGSLVYKPRPLLYVEKGAVVLSSTLLTPALFPLYVYHDLKSIEKTVRKLDKQEYVDDSIWSQKRCVADFLFE